MNEGGLSGHRILLCGEVGGRENLRGCALRCFEPPLLIHCGGDGLRVAGTVRVLRVLLCVLRIVRLASYVSASPATLRAELVQEALEHGFSKRSPRRHRRHGSQVRACLGVKSKRCRL